MSFKVRYHLNRRSQHGYILRKRKTAKELFTQRLSFSWGARRESAERARNFIASMLPCFEEL